MVEVRQECRALGMGRGEKLFDILPTLPLVFVVSLLPLPLADIKNAFQ
jgi:hypothetical protein